MNFDFYSLGFPGGKVDFQPFSVTLSAVGATVEGQWM